MSGLGSWLGSGSGSTGVMAVEWANAAAAVLGLPVPVLRATAAGVLLCLLGWGAWRLAERDVTRRRQGWLFPRSHRTERTAGAFVHRLGMKPRAGTRPPPELLLLPLGLLAAWPTHSPLVAVVAAGAVLPAIRLRSRRRTARLEERRRRAVVGLCAALAGELRTGATPHQAVETAVSDGTVPDAQALDCTVLLAAVRYGGSLPEAFQSLAELPGADGAAGIAACWQVSSSSGAGLAEGLDRVAEGLRAERSLAESIRAELAGPRSTAGLLAALPLFGLLLGIALGADPLRMLLHTPSGLACLFGGALLEWAGLAWTARIARGAEAVPA
ncbi:tight adherence protein B [Streptacidiphilus sp. EB103A]